MALLIGPTVISAVVMSDGAALIGPPRVDISTVVMSDGALSGLSYSSPYTDIAVL
ncbi:hypothetical protein KCP78_18375 [Salmonella enterica subsp. enterica]|nr:hypothetical protein KCP78_18375 [Salmonella enterica subsp. enterica]